MKNKKKYDQSFMKIFSIEESVLDDDFLYNSIPELGSVGQHNHN